MTIRKRRLATTAAALAAAAALCGYGVPAVAAPTEADAAFCDAQVAFDTAMNQLGGDEEGGPSPADVLSPRLDELESTAPEHVADEVATFVGLWRDALASEDPEALDALFESPELAAANDAIDQHLLGSCGFYHLDVTASEYQFDGVPAEIPAGKTAVTLTNAGEEFHMFVIFRFNDGETMSVDEALALPDEEALTHVTPMGEVFRAPGTADTAFYDLPAGRYGAACFMTVGSKPGAPEPPEDAPMHFMKGMTAEFQVGPAAAADSED